MNDSAHGSGFSSAPWTLAGQNVGQAARLAEESIQEAKTLFEQHQKEMDTTLGDLNELHKTGPSMPRLTPVLPTVTYEDFVQRALSEEGFHMSPSDDGMLQAQKPGRPPELISFDEDQWRANAQPGVFMGKAPKLYLPGKPEYERLVQRWLDRGGHFVSDLRDQTDARARDLFERWLVRIDGAELTAVETLERRSVFQGRTRCKVTASNSLDSYEKLLDVELLPEDHSNIYETATEAITVAPEELDPARVVPDLNRNTQQVVESDEDVIAFCDFYGARLEDEHSKAGESIDRRRKVEGDLRPAIHAQAVAMTGILYESGLYLVGYSIDGHDHYSAEFDACPVTGQMFAEPENWLECAETGRKVPSECLGKCEISRQQVLRHLLIVSHETGRTALERYTVQCDVSGRIALEDEFAQSDLSGRQAVASAFLTSPISGRRGLPDEFRACEYTGVDVLQDELLVSNVGQKAYRRDETATSTVSNRQGHRSEFLQCELTGESILPEEGERSDASGRFVRKDKIVASSIPPHRRGAVDEIVVCAQSSRKLLRDEAGTCAVTGLVVDKCLLAASDLSGEVALADRLVTCEATGKRMLPTEVVTSAVSGKRISPDVAHESPVSGKHALQDECVPCELTGTLVLPEELRKSDVSGAKFRIDEAVTSAEFGRVGHRMEAAICDFSGRMLLIDEVGKSDVSGKTASKRELVSSQKSRRIGHRTEAVACAASRKQLLIDESATSAVSGLIVDKELLVRSDRSGRLALREEVMSCSISGATLLPEEVDRCMASGVMVDRRLLQQSDLSDARALPDKLVHCPVTGEKGLPQEFVRCALTGDLIAPAGVAVCVVTGKAARRDKLIRSVVSGRWMVPSAAIRSIVDRQPMCPNEAVYCFWNEGYLHPSQASTCRRTGLTLQRELISPSGEFIYLRQLLEGRLVMGDASNLKKWLRSQRNGKLKEVKRVWSVPSPRGGVLLVFAELHNWMGLNVRHAAIVVRVRPQLEILGEITCNSNGPRGWFRL